MTPRFTLTPPLAAAGSWPARPRAAVKRAPRSMALHYAPVMDPASATAIALEYIQTQAEEFFRINTARRDADAAKYGEPRNAEEFYHGREEGK